MAAHSAHEADERRAAGPLAPGCTRRRHEHRQYQVGGRGRARRGGAHRAGGQSESRDEQERDGDGGAAGRSSR